MTNTQRTLAALLAGSLALGAAAQQDPPKPATIRPAPRAGNAAPAPTQEELIAKRDEKLKLPFLQKAPWLTDYDAARAAAKKTGKPIFVYFSRSYAH